MMMVRELSTYILAVLLVILAFTPLIHVYEERSYYKVYTLHLRDNGEAVRSMEGFKDYLLWEGELALPREFFADFNEYWKYKSISRCEMLKIMVYRVNGGLREWVLSVEGVKHRGMGVREIVRNIVRSLPKGEYLVKIKMFLPDFLKDGLGLTLKDTTVCEVYAFNEGNHRVLLVPLDMPICPPGLEEYTVDDVIAKYKFHLESPLLALFKVLAWLSYPAVLALTVYSVSVLKRKVKVYITLICIIALTLLVYTHTLLVCDVQAYIDYALKRHRGPLKPMIVDGELLVVYGVNKLVTVNVTKEVTEISLGSLLNRYERRTLDYLVEREGIGKVWFTIDTNLPVNIIGALKTSRGLYSVDYEELDKVKIIVDTRKVSESLKGEPLELHVDLSIGIPKTVRTYLKEHP